MGRVDPAGLNALVQAVRSFGIDAAFVQNQAAEGRLDVPAGAAKSIVKIEMAEGRVDIVAPEQADRPATKPDAFGITGGTGDRALDVGVLVDFLRRLLGGGGFAAGRGSVGRLRQGRTA